MSKFRTQNTPKPYGERLEHLRSAIRESMLPDSFQGRVSVVLFDIDKMVSEHGTAVVNRAVECYSLRRMGPYTARIRSQRSEWSKMIEEARKAAELTVAQLSLAVGLDIRTVQRHISGATRPWPVHREKYEQVLKVRFPIAR